MGNGSKGGNKILAFRPKTSYPLNIESKSWYTKTMQQRERQQTLFRRFFASRLFLFAALIVALLIALGYARAYYQDYKIRQEIRELESQVKSLEKKKLESMDILEYVMSQDFVEEKARTELNLRKPGEKVAIIKGPGQEELGGNYENEEAGQDLSNPVKWLYYFLTK